MSLDTYTNLKATIQDWAHDSEVQPRVDDIILLCETEIYNPAPLQTLIAVPLRVREMQTRATASADTTSRFLALPTGYLSMRNLTYSTGGKQVDVRLSAPESLRVQSAAGMPRYYTVTSQLEFDRIPDSAYTMEMNYYKKPTALSSSNQTNDILTNYPNVYLFGCLWAFNMFAGENNQAALWKQQMLGAIRGANKATKRGAYSAAPVMRTEGLTP